MFFLVVSTENHVFAEAQDVFACPARSIACHTLVSLSSASLFVFQYSLVEV